MQSLYRGVLDRGKITNEEANMMPFIVRDDEIIPIKVPAERRIKIGSNYTPKLQNMIAADQLWIQDIYFLNKLPLSAIKYRVEKGLLYLVLWGSIVATLNTIARHYL
jgi:hypothetical protein